MSVFNQSGQSVDIQINIDTNKIDVNRRTIAEMLHIIDCYYKLHEYAEEDHSFEGCSCDACILVRLRKWNGIF